MTCMNTFSSGQEDLTWGMDLLKKMMSPNNYLGSFTDNTAYFFWMSVLFILLVFPYLKVLVFLYFSNFLLHIYKRNVHLKETYQSKSWDNGRKAVAHLWDIYGTVWHELQYMYRYPLVSAILASVVSCFRIFLPGRKAPMTSPPVYSKVNGMDKVPEGPGLFVFYHGAFPIDYFYFVSRLYLKTGRFCHTVVDYFFFLIPGIKLFYNVEGFTHNGRMECAEILKRGNSLGVFPGGAREAYFSDENYGLLWGSRTGFAHVAREAKVPVIPVFTTNLREGYRSLGKIWPFRWFYERTRFPLIPTYGGFPVKFCTYIGDPIPYNPNISAEELAEKTKTAIEDLRNKHQEIPGSIRKALLERFHKHQKN